MIDTSSSVIALGRGHKTIHYRFENTPCGSALLHAFAESYRKRLVFDDKVKEIDRQVFILLSHDSKSHENVCFTVDVVSYPIGIYANPLAFSGQIARRVALYAGLPFRLLEYASDSIQIGIGDQADNIEGYFLLKDILYWLPTLI